MTYESTPKYENAIEQGLDVVIPPQILDSLEYAERSLEGLAEGTKDFIKQINIQISTGAGENFKITAEQAYAILTRTFKDTQKNFYIQMSNGNKTFFISAEQAYNWLNWAFNDKLEEGDTGE